MFIDCCLSGTKELQPRGCTDVTQSLSPLHRATSDLCHGPGGVGAALRTETARRSLPGYRPETIHSFLALLDRRRTDDRGFPVRRSLGVCRVSQPPPQDSGLRRTPLPETPGQGI